MWEIRQLVAYNLRRLRNAAGLSQEELAARADINRGYLANLEIGKRYYPSVRTLDQLAHTLGVEITELLLAPPSGAKLPKAPAPPSRRKRSPISE